MSAPTVEEHGPWAQAVTPLSKTEEEVLRLYDRLQELKLEMALLQSHQAYQQGKWSVFPSLLSNTVMAKRGTGRKKMFQRHTIKTYL